MNPFQTKKSRLKVGIWLKYHVTLEACEGIGVFAHNLARGLAKIPDGPEVVLCIHPGDEHVVRETVEHGRGRILVGVEQSSSVERSSKRRIGHRILRLLRRVSGQLTGLLSRGSQSFRLLKYPTVASSWATELLSDICNRNAAITPKDPIQRLIDQCDVWLVPYVALPNIKFSRPTVVAIHDLIPYHFPDTCTPEFLAQLRVIVSDVAARSTVAACMSQFIRQNDLKGQLNLPDEKIRVVTPAVPSDFGAAGDFEETSKKYPVLQSRYLFYPAAFRKYKNHGLLVRALEELRKRGDQSLQVVFTGICETPPELQKLITKLQLTDRVHVLGKVDRKSLALLYRHALATVVPSLYEQGSFPLMEALHWKCPIACSRIPALLEYFSPMQESVLYFDPHNESDAADVLARLIEQRAEILHNQQAGFLRMGERTWTDAARDWMEVFEYAVQRHQQLNETLQAPAAYPAKAA